jgi:hypothetical protein
MAGQPLGRCPGAPGDDALLVRRNRADPPPPRGRGRRGPGRCPPIVWGPPADRTARRTGAPHGGTSSRSPVRAPPGSQSSPRSSSFPGRGHRPAVFPRPGREPGEPDRRRGGRTSRRANGGEDRASDVGTVRSDFGSGRSEGEEVTGEPFLLGDEEAVPGGVDLEPASGDGGGGGPAAEGERAVRSSIPWSTRVGTVKAAMSGRRSLSKPVRVIAIVARGEARRASETPQSIISRDTVPTAPPPKNGAAPAAVAAGRSARSGATMASIASASMPLGLSPVFSRNGVVVATRATRATRWTPCPDRNRAMSPQPIEWPTRVTPRRSSRARTAARSSARES